jgi:hypothetical protein
MDSGSVYARQYVGGGINIGRFEYSTSNRPPAKVGNNQYGAQVFTGAEVTFKAIPQMSLGFDIGFHLFNDFNSRALGVRVLAKYYIW